MKNWISFLILMVSLSAVAVNVPYSAFDTNSFTVDVNNASIKINPTNWPPGVSNTFPGGVSGQLQVNTNGHFGGVTVGSGLQLSGGTLTTTGAVSVAQVISVTSSNGAILITNSVAADGHTNVDLGGVSSQAVFTAVPSLVTTAPAFSSWDDIYNLSINTHTPPPTSIEWESPWPNARYLSLGGNIWHPAGASFNEFVYGEGVGGQGLNPPGAWGVGSTGSPIMVPLGTTQLVWSASVKFGPDTNGSTLNYSWISQPTAIANFYGQKTVTLNNVYQPISLTNNFPGTATNVAVWFWASSFTISNLAVTYLPTPTNFMFVNGKRYQVLARNVIGGNYHSQPPPETPCPYMLQPSGNSYVEFKTDASMVTLIIDASDAYASPVNISVETPVVIVNGVTNFMLTLSTNPIYQPFLINLPTNRINTVQVLNGHSTISGENYLRAVYVPITNSLAFTQSKNEWSMMVFGDSVANGQSSTNRFTTPFYLAGDYLGVDIKLMADGSALLQTNFLPQNLASYAQSKVAAIWNEHMINNYQTSDPTNRFYNSYLAAVDMEHSIFPGAVIFCQDAPFISAEGVANGVGAVPQDYRKIIMSVAAVRPFCRYVETTNWFLNPLIIGVHPTQSSNVKYAYLIATNMEWAMVNLFQYLNPTTTYLSANVAALGNVNVAGVVSSAVSAHNTNTAALSYVPGGVVLATPFNAPGQRSGLHISGLFTDSLGGEPILVMSNFTSGLVWTNTIAGGVAGTQPFTFDYPYWSSNDLGVLVDKSSGTGSSVSISGSTWIKQ